MAGSDFVLTGSRIANATRVWQAAEDADKTGWTIGDALIIAAMIETTKHGGATATMILRWRNVTDGGSFAPLSGSGELAWGATTDLVNGNALASGESGCTPVSGITYANGVEREGANDVSVNLAQNNYSESHWAINTANAIGGKQYEFELYDSTAAASLGTFAAQFTIQSSGYTLTAEAGSFAVSGSDVGFAKGRRLVAEAGAFTLSGVEVALLRTAIIAAAPGSFALTGVAVGLNKGRRIVAEAGAFILAGADAPLLAGRHILILSGNFIVEGQQVGFVYTSQKAYAASRCPSIPSTPTMPQIGGAQ